jgi:hypothetical protein
MLNRKDITIILVGRFAAAVVIILAIIDFIREYFLRGIGSLCVGCAILISLHPSKKAQTIAILLALIFFAINILGIRV